jgi:hypothetical protein
MDDALYWIQSRPPAGLAFVSIFHCNHLNSFVSTRGYRMTYLEVVYRYGAAPGESELRAIDGMREVYGIRRVHFNEKDRTVLVEFDASRLKADAVSHLLRQAGIDVREPMALA